MLGSVSKLGPLDVLEDMWWIGAVALGVSLIATPIVRLIAYRVRIVDRPDDLLKPHSRPTAYLGGLAMCAGLLVGRFRRARAFPVLSRRVSFAAPHSPSLRACERKYRTVARSCAERGLSCAWISA